MTPILIRKFESCCVLQELYQQLYKNAQVRLGNVLAARKKKELELVNEKTSGLENLLCPGFVTEHMPILVALYENLVERRKVFFPEMSLVITTMTGKEFKPPLNIASATVGELREWVANQCSTGTLQVELVNAGRKIKSDDMLLSELESEETSEADEKLGQRICLSLLIVLMRGIPDDLYMLLSDSVISCTLPQVFASGKWADDFDIICPIVDEKGRKCVMSRLAECRRLALDTLAPMLPDEFQAKPVDLRIPGIAPVLPRLSRPHMDYRG
jgi:hypothetical protein